MNNSQQIVIQQKGQKLDNLWKNMLYLENKLKANKQTIKLC